MANRVVIVGGIAIVVILALFVVIPALQPSGMIDAQLTVQYYYQGNLVEEEKGWWPFAFVRAKTGAKVDEIRVGIDWEITGTDIQQDSLFLTGVIEISELYQRGERLETVEEVLTTDTFGSDKWDWFVTFGHSLDGILLRADGKSHWQVKITGTLNAEAIDDWGATVEAQPWTSEYYESYDWDDDAGTLKIGARWL